MYIYPYSVGEWEKRGWKSEPELVMAQEQIWAAVVAVEVIVVKENIVILNEKLVRLFYSMEFLKWILTWRMKYVVYSGSPDRCDRQLNGVNFVMKKLNWTMFCTDIFQIAWHIYLAFQLWTFPSHKTKCWVLFIPDIYCNLSKLFYRLIRTNNLINLKLFTAYIWRSNLRQSEMAIGTNEILLFCW